MGGFFRGLSQGIDNGIKLGNAWNDASLRREIKDANSTTQTQDPQYTQDQVDQLRDPAEKAGGVWDADNQSYKMPDGTIQAPAAAPTYSDGHYNTPDGTAVAPKTRFSLGNRTQDTAFTADDIANEKLNRKADIYSSYGKEDLAEQMRSNALSRQLSGLQIKKAQDEDANIQAWKSAQTGADKYRTEAHALLADVTDQVNSGAMPIQQGVAKLLHHNAESLPDGKNYSIDPVKGTLFLTQNGKTSTVTGHDGKPIVADVAHLSEIGSLIEGKTADYLKQKFLDTHPEAWMQGQALEQNKEISDKNYTAGREDAANNNTYRTGELKVLQDTQAHKVLQDEAENKIKQQELGLKGRLVNAQVGALGRKADAGELDITPEQSAKLQELSDAYETETDPRKRAKIAQDIQIVSNHVAIQNKRFPSLGNAAKPIKELGPVEDAKIEEMLMGNKEFSKGSKALKDTMRHEAYVKYGYATPEEVQLNDAPPQVGGTVTNTGGLRKPTGVDTMTGNLPPAVPYVFPVKNKNGLIFNNR